MSTWFNATTTEENQQPCSSRKWKKKVEGDNWENPQQPSLIISTMTGNKRIRGGIWLSNNFHCQHNRSIFKFLLKITKHNLSPSAPQSFTVTNKLGMPCHEFFSRSPKTQSTHDNVFLKNTAGIGNWKQQQQHYPPAFTHNLFTVSFILLHRWNRKETMIIRTFLYLYTLSEVRLSSSTAAVTQSIPKIAHYHHQLFFSIQLDLEIKG